MSQASIFFVGQNHEVAHHAAPLQGSLHVAIEDANEVLAKAVPGDLAIFYSEHFDRFRHCCQELNRRNVATLYMIDGILEWRNAWENSPDEVACPYAMRPVLSHKVACIGQSQARVLAAWGNQGKTEVIGIPRLELGPSSTNRKSSDNTFRVLIMTAKTPGFTQEQIATVQKSLNDLKAWRETNRTIECRIEGKQSTREIEFVWRLTAGLDQAICVENQISDLTGKELADVLSRVDAVISTPSTAMLEAMQRDIPVAVLDYHNCPHYVNAGWDICSAEHIGPTIAQMAKRDDVRMLFQQTELADALNVNGNAQSRMVELVQTMLNLAASQIKNQPDCPLTFPAQILEPLPATFPSFVHGDLYPGANEFAISDKAELQVELSHARREILHLQRELDQSRSELDQAHQIFEQIEKHPIAGPVVRIRQKMLDLMTAMRNRKNNVDSSHPTHNLNPSPPKPDSPLN